MYYTLHQLANITGRSPKTLRLHIRLGYLRAEKSPGVRGWRVKSAVARTWASKHFGVNLDA